MPNGFPQPFFTFAGSAARAASGNGDALDLIALSGWQPANGTPQLLVQVDATAATGTSPTLAVVIEDSIDGGVTWNTIATFTSITTVSRQVQQCAVSGVAQAAGFRWPFNARRVRARWTLGGTTPNFTFSVRGVLV